MKKTELIEAMRRDRAALDTLVGALDDAQLTQPALDAGWSVKDVLAHVSAWERLCASWLEDVAHGRMPERPEVRDVDGTNAREYERARDLPRREILAASRRSYEAILDSVRALSEADLADQTRFGWPTWQMASSNSDEHYREHTDQIESWLRRG